MSALQERIERAAAKLAALKLQQQSREAREKARNQQATRAARNRALVLWGVAFERAALASPGVKSQIRATLESHLTRENERVAALAFLGSLDPTTPPQSTRAGDQNESGGQ